MSDMKTFEELWEERVKTIHEGGGEMMGIVKAEGKWWYKALVEGGVCAGKSTPICNGVVPGGVGDCPWCGKPLEVMSTRNGSWLSCLNTECPVQPESGKGYVSEMEARNASVRG